MTVSAKEKRQTRESEEIAEIRRHLAFLTKNIITIPDEQVDDGYKDNLKDMVSKLRFYCSHGYWDGDEQGPKTPMSHIFNMICRKNGGIAKLVGAIAGPRMTGWTRHERQIKDMLSASLIRATTWTPPPVYQPQWELPLADPRNDHPGAVNYRARKEEFAEQSRKMKHAREQAKSKKKIHLKKEAPERLKVKTQQRKDRKKHFAEQNKKRGKK
jgi:hypothetical protein